MTASSSSSSLSSSSLFLSLLSLLYYACSHDCSACVSCSLLVMACVSESRSRLMLRCSSRTDSTCVSPRPPAHALAPASSGERPELPPRHRETAAAAAAAAADAAVRRSRTSASARSPKPTRVPERARAACPPRLRRVWHGCALSFARGCTAHTRCTVRGCTTKVLRTMFAVRP